MTKHRPPSETVRNAFRWAVGGAVYKEFILTIIYAKYIVGKLT